MSISLHTVEKFLDASNKPISHLSAFAFGVLTMQTSIEYRNGSEDLPYFVFASFFLGLQTVLFYFATPIAPPFPIPKMKKTV
jgi:hypothetical protein